MRILITGWPGSGKTTLAQEMGGGRSTDEVMGLGWSESSAEVAKWFDSPGPWVIEGVAVPRAIRKWMKANPDKELPFDKIINLKSRHRPLDTKAYAMGKGIDTVWNEIRPQLGSVEIEER